MIPEPIISYRIVLTYAVFRLDIQSNKVIRAAPIAKWTTGKSLSDVINYWKRKHVYKSGDTL